MGLYLHLKSWALLVILLCGLLAVLQAHAQTQTQTQVQSSAQIATLSDAADGELRIIEVAPDDSVAQQVGDVEHSEFTGSHAHIDSSALETKGGNVASVLAHEAGIQYRQSGGMGSYSAVSIRAASSAQTNIYFDGILLNDASSGGVDLSQLDLLNIASIDIYRGSTPIQLGVAAIGGAVNLKTSQNGKPSTGLLTSFGSFSSSRLQLNRQLAGSDWDATAAFSLQRSNNRFDLLNTGGTPLNLSDDVTEKRINAEFERSSVLLKLGRQQGPDIRYDALLQIADREQGVPHWRNRADNRANYSTQSLQFQLNRRVSARAGQNWSSSSGVFINGNIEDYDDRQSQIGLGAQLTHSDTNVLGARTYWERVSTTGTLAVNGEIRNETLSQNDRLLNTDDSATRSRFDGAMQYSLFMLDERLLLTPALRLQSLSDNYDGLLRRGKKQRRDSSAQLQFGARWESTARWQATFNAGQYQREPVFFELFGDRGLFIGNDDIAPESGTNVDVGLHWASTGLNDNGRSMAVSITGFLSLRDELIVTSFDARGIGRSENSGRARISGLEAVANWQLGKRWQASLNFTLQSAKNLSRVSGFTDNQLPGEAQSVAYARLKHSRTLELPVAVFNWELWYEFDALRNRFFDTANLLPANDQFVQNLGMKVSASDLSVSLRINNIADQETQDFNGFSKPGRSFELAVAYSL